MNKLNNRSVWLICFLASILWAMIERLCNIGIGDQVLLSFIFVGLMIKESYFTNKD